MFSFPVMQLAHRILAYVKKECKVMPLLGTYPKEFKAGSQRGICTSMFTVALFTRAKRWKQPKSPLTDECIKKMWYIRSTEYYAAFKKKDILLHATTSVNLEDIMQVK